MEFFCIYSWIELKQIPKAKVSENIESIKIPVNPECLYTVYASIVVKQIL